MPPPKKETPEEEAYLTKNPPHEGQGQEHLHPLPQIYRIIPEPSTSLPPLEELAKTKEI